MAMPASSTAAQPTTYVTFRNPSVLQHLVRKAWTAGDYSGQLCVIRAYFDLVFGCWLPLQSASDWNAPTR